MRIRGKRKSPKERKKRSKKSQRSRKEILLKTTLVLAVFIQFLV
jgi:hypothetical protein